MGSTSRSGVTRFGVGAAVFVLAAGSLFNLGCARQPYVMSAASSCGADDSAVDTAEVIEADAPAIYIIVPPGADVAQTTEAPVVVQKVAQPPQERWTPSPVVATNPFERFRTWVGDYDCAQGNTGMALRIVDVRGRVIRAIFDFTHSPSGAAGKYIVSGAYDPETRSVRFEPSQWLEQPDNYIMVPMTGEISLDDSLFAGKINHPSCGAFKLKPTR